jgi:D-alanyl-D-alanine carboxypeptidase (penicillin-binding protein 5/6)
MLKMVILLLSYAHLIFPHLVAAPLSIEIEGEAGILMNAETGAILFEKNKDVLHYPASTTKVATALYALHLKKDALDTLITATSESLATISVQKKINSNYTLPSYWLEPNSCHISIKKDEEFTLYDLLRGVLIRSGNDASNVVAYALGEGSIPRFMDELNVFLKQLGCTKTKFFNPHGLHHPQHQTTAYDLALMTKEALKDPIFCEIVAQKSFVKPKTSKQKAMTFLSTNRLIRPGPLYYDKAIGVKTGSHSLAKKAFIGAARYNGRTLIAVLLRCESRDRMFKSAKQLFEAAFNQPKVHRVLLAAGIQKFRQNFPHAAHPLKTYLKEDLSLDYYPAEDPQVKCFLCWDPLALPLHKDQRVGELQLIAQNGALLAKRDLLAQNDVIFKWPYNWIEGSQLSKHPFMIGSSLLIGIIAIIAIFLGRRRSD